MFDFLKNIFVFLTSALSIITSPFISGDKINPIMSPAPVIQEVEKKTTPTPTTAPIIYKREVKGVQWPTPTSYPTLTLTATPTPTPTPTPIQKVNTYIPVDTSSTTSQTSQTTSSPAPTINTEQYPIPVFTPITSIPTPTAMPMTINTQISFSVYWKNNEPRADYKTSVCLDSLDVVWGHFYIIDPNGQEQNTGNHDYRQKPCQNMNVVGYSLAGKPLGEYTFKAVFDELGITKTSKAILGPPSL